MDHEAAAVPVEKAWLALKSGPLAGVRHALNDAVTRVGRDPGNEVVIRGPEAATVSLNHLEISRTPAGFSLRDLGSTNGTFVNGERVAECELRSPATIRLGTQGPELIFVAEAASTAALDDTLVLPQGAVVPPAEPATPAAGDFEALLSDAVARARHARSTGFGDQTITIMREALGRALRHTGRRLRVTIVILVAALAAVSTYGGWKVAALTKEKRAIDERIHAIELRLQTAVDNPEQTDRLIAELSQYQTEAERLEQSLLYRVGVRAKEEFLTQEIRTLMAEFGAEVYSVPPEFADRVNHYVKQYQGPDRPLLERAFGDAAPKLKTMREVLDQEQLPADLAYIPLVESALAPQQAGTAGPAGLWQFTAATARAQGLRVDGAVDERLDLQKATRAGCRYLRALILDFGTGSSVMLALAAYNLGPTKVKQAVMRTVRDPIKQRNFWYLYRTRALPEETREYVPKVLAAMIIGRNAERFGFQPLK